MKILHVIAGLAKAAGTSVFCGEVARQQVRTGHAVTIAVCDPDSDDRYPLDPRIRIVRASELLAKPPEGMFDTVHIHALWDPILHRAARWARKGGCRIVWSPHGMLTPWALRNHWWKKIPALLLYQYRDLRCADLIHATAASEVEDVRRLGLRNEIVVAPLGVEVPDGEGKTGGESRRTKAGRVRTVLFLSRIQRKKGLPDLLRAWDEVGRGNEEFGANWRLVIAGPDQEGHLAELQALCDGLKLEWSGPENPRETRVRFVGPVYGEEKDRLYREADLFVLPTKSENFGSVVVESLAQGTPVVCTKGAPWQELERERCGWWIDLGVGPLKTALEKAMALTDEERAEMGRRGLDLVRRQYGWSSVAARLMSRIRG